MRAWLYNTAIHRITAPWYRQVLSRLPRGCRLLDVGIGTGSALLANAEILAAKDIRVTGVDIDPAYVEACRRAIAAAGLVARIKARLESIYDHHGGPYDAVYFSASFMLLPDPAAALLHVRSLLAPGGRLYFTQTFEERRSAFVEWVKPLLRRLTSIDFGRVTYEDDFRAVLAAAGVAIEEMRTLHGGARRSGRLVVGTPCPR
jgi:SAM-dependent methyltransferase